MTQPISHTFRALGLAALLAFGAPVLAQDAADSVSAQETPWQVSCQPQAEAGKLACNLSKSLITTNDGRLIAQATVFPDESGAFMMRIIAPHGMDIASGLTLSVDDTELVQTGFTTSLPGGIVALFTMPAELVDAMRRGAMLQVASKQRSGGGFAFAFGLTGISASLDKLK